MDSKLGPARNVLRFLATSSQSSTGRARVGVAAFLSLAAFVGSASISRADEGGVSFWIPGLFGSLAATPQVPGWTLATINYYTSVTGGGNLAASRQITINKFNATVNVNLNANLKASGDLVLAVPSYVFATPVFGGQFAVSMAGATGRSIATINGTLTASVGGLSATRQGTLEDGRDGFTDLYPQANLRWNSGANNWLTYVMGDIPVGTYSSSNLANLGIGHGAIDGGVGYTYFNPKDGHEFSAVTGVTYNFVNPSIGYQNGIDWHLDWGASQFLTKQIQVGLVGYVYRQLTADRGGLPILGSFESQVVGIGPQIGYIFPVAGMQGYLNLKGYGEFDGDNRPHGWNTWLTLVLSPAPSAEPSPPPMLTKTPPHG
jgi:hypothetical protein